MIVRDTATGALHEVPESQLYEVGDMTYDGFGNPVGFNFLDTITAPFRAIGQAASGLLRPAIQAFAPPPPPAMTPHVVPPGVPFPMAQPALPPPAYAMPQPAYPGAPPGYPAPPPSPFPPPGWMPQGQFPIGGANRLYLRCSAWPGPAGMAPGPGLMAGGVMPGVIPGQLMPAQPAAPRYAPLRRYRRRR
jgi:hypothetical protein